MFQGEKARYPGVMFFETCGVLTEIRIMVAVQQKLYSTALYNQEYSTIVNQIWSTKFYNMVHTDQMFAGEHLEERDEVESIL